MNYDSKKRKIYRMLWTFVTPVIIVLVLYLSSIHKGSITYKDSDNISTTTYPLAEKAGQINVDLEPSLFANIFLGNIIFDRLQYKVCLTNFNRLILDNQVINSNDLGYSDNENIGAMNLSFFFADGSLLELYANASTTSCTVLSQGKLSTSRLSGSFRWLHQPVHSYQLTSTGSDVVSKDLGVSTTIVDLSLSKIYISIDPNSKTQWLELYLGALIVWAAIIVLFGSIREFILKGFSE